MRRSNDRYLENLPGTVAATAKSNCSGDDFHGNASVNAQVSKCVNCAEQLAAHNRKVVIIDGI